MRTDKILVCLFIFLAAGAGIFAHVNQDLRLQIARAEEARLDAMGCVGWLSFDEETGRFEFSGRNRGRQDHP